MIERDFLTEIAEYTENKIAKVVLNDSWEITDFLVKEMTDTKVGMQYLIPAAQISLVTKIALVDQNGLAISTNEVYIPIASDTLLLQTIQVKEASA